MARKTRKGFKDLEEFWPFYISQHMRKENRQLHFAGTTLGLACLGAAALTGRKRYVPLGLLLGYGLSWVGHFFVEKNRPATFEYPLFSFTADLRMYRLMLEGKMEKEISRQKDRIKPYLRR